MSSPALWFAHGVDAGRADLPISRELFIASALAVLAVSFVALAALWSQPKLEQSRARELPRAVSAILLARPLAIIWSDRRLRLGRDHPWMFVVMVGFTILALLLLLQSNS